MADDRPLQYIGVYIEDTYYSLDLGPVATSHATLHMSPVGGN